VYADHVIALDKKGYILHQGSFEQLQSDTDYLHGLDIKQNGSANAQDKAEPSAINHPTASRSRSLGKEPESPNQFLGEFATYGYYLGSVPLWYPIIFAAFIILYGGGFKMTELLLSFWTSHPAAKQETNNFYLGLYGMLAGIAIIGTIGSVYFFFIFMVPLSSEVLHARLLKSVIEAPLSFFSETDVGVTTNRFSQDMSVIDTELPFSMIDFALSLSITLMAAILMCVFSGYFAAIMPLIIFFCWRELTVTLLANIHGADIRRQFCRNFMSRHLARFDSSISKPNRLSLPNSSTFSKG
jgi:ATP-binding cassette subfamily C (CFTR/MRP) protein 1